MNKIYTLILIILSVGVTQAASVKNRGANTIILDEVGVKNLRLETVEVEETSFDETLFALGRIRVAPGHRAVVSSRIPGRAITVRAHIDTAIEKNSEVAAIESRQPGDPPPTVRLTAPMSGFVSAVNIVAGQPVTPDAALLEIIDLQEVHAVAAVPEHLVSQLRIGQKARMRVPAFPGKDFPARLEHLGAEAEKESGTLEAAFHVDNPDFSLRPGMRAEFSIITSTREGVMVVPREALQGDAGGRFVYVADYELKDAFVKIPVQLGAQNDRFIEITSGLLPGDRVVTRGAYSLAFAGKGSISLKEALDAAHGHPHNEDGSEMTREQRAAAAKASGIAGRQKQFTGLAKFFAATTAALLIVCVALRRRMVSS